MPAYIRPVSIRCRRKSRCCQHLCQLVLCGLLLLPSLAQSKPSILIQTPAQAKKETKESFIQYGKAGTWLDQGSHRTLLLEDRRLDRVLAQVTVAATAAAASSLIPAFMGVRNPTFYSLFQLSGLVLPCIYFFRNLASDSSQWLNHPISIIDDPFLTRQLTITLEHNQKLPIQKLIFRRLPVAPGLPLTSGASASLTPLQRLSTTMGELGSDYLLLRWFGSHHPHLQIIVAGEQIGTRVIALPDWGTALAKTTAATSPETNHLVPVILNLLRSENLDILATLLSSTLTKTSTARDFFSPDTEPLSITPLTGQRIGHYYWLALSPEHNTHHTLRWAIAFEKPTSFPDHGEPLILHTRTSRFTRIPQSTQVIRILKPWQTDLLAMLPYSVIFLGMNYLLHEGPLNQTQTMPPAILTTLFGKLFGNQIGAPYDPYSGGGTNSYWSNRHSPRPWFVDSGYPNKQPRLTAPFNMNHQTLVSAVEDAGAPQPVADIYQQEQTMERTLTHRGNNCFFNATLSHMAQTLTEAQLERIATQPQALSENQQEVYEELCNSFVTLMKSMQSTANQEASDQQWQDVQKNFQQALLDFTLRTENPTLRTVLLNPNVGTVEGNQQTQQSVNDLCQQQSDAHEFMTALWEALQLSDDQSHYLILDAEREVLVGDALYKQTELSPDLRYHTLSVSIPAENSIRHQKISDVDTLVNRSFLQRVWVNSISDQIYLSPQRIRELRVNDDRLQEQGGNFSFFHRNLLAHSHVEQLQSINMHLKLYEASGKLNGITHRLLHGHGTIHLPVQSLEDGARQVIAMEPHAMILHHGSTMHSGHYIAAFYRDGNWFIHDDLNDYIIKITTTENTTASGKTALDQLASYLENHNLDPYIINYRRISSQ